MEDDLLVTKISPAVKNPNRVNIYINGKYNFSLDLAQVVDYKIKTGQKLTVKKLTEYQHASEFGKLYQRTLEWVLTRPHSVFETRDYLRKKRQRRKTQNLSSFSDNDIENIIKKLTEKKYLNDLEFAKYYTENRFTKSGISAKRLKMELIKKGISRDIIDQVLNNSTRNDETEIFKIIEKKRSRYDDDKLINYLVRQGFDYHLAKTTVKKESF